MKKIVKISDPEDFPLNGEMCFVSFDDGTEEWICLAFIKDKNLKEGDEYDEEVLYPQKIVQEVISVETTDMDSSDNPSDRFVDFILQFEDGTTGRVNQISNHDFLIKKGDKIQERYIYPL